MADDERSVEHSEEGNEGDEDLSQRVGADEPVVQVQSVFVDPESSQLSRPALHRTPRDNVQVEGVASAHRSQLYDLTTLTCGNNM